MSFHKFLPFVLMLLFFTACKENIQYHGDSYLNYPDMESILRESIDRIKSEPVIYQKVVLDVQTKKSDTILVPYDKMDWDEIKSHFLKANIQTKKYDKKYDIGILNDTLTRSRTVLYSAKDPNLYTHQLNIVANQDDNKIRSIYIECEDNGFFSSKTEKLLLSPGSTIQIQEKTKRPLQKEQFIITTYKFEY